MACDSPACQKAMLRTKQINYAISIGTKIGREQGMAKIIIVEQVINGGFTWFAGDDERLSTDKFIEVDRIIL